LKERTQRREGAKADESGKPGKLRLTAAMMAKVTDHLWTFEEFCDPVINYG
jgi:hypothetical protein